MVGKLTGGLLVGALALSVCMAVGRAEDKEVKVTLDQVPAAVKATLVKEAGTATIDSVEKEGDGDTAVYEGEAKIDGKEYEIKVGADGKLISKKLDDDDDDKDAGGKK